MLCFSDHFTCVSMGKNVLFGEVIIGTEVESSPGIIGLNLSCKAATCIM